MTDLEKIEMLREHKSKLIGLLVILDNCPFDNTRIGALRDIERLMEECLKKENK